MLDGAARILEKQKLLQMSQFYSVVVLLFKDSTSGTADLEILDFQITRSMHEERTNAVGSSPRAFVPQQKFGPAISEAAELGRCHAQRDVATPTARWSEARPR